MKSAKESTVEAPKRILVIDDDASIRELFTVVLQDSGYLVDSASTAMDALDIATFEPPDLCIVDLVMPGMSGLDCLPLLRTVVKVPAIVISQRKDAQAVDCSIENGVACFLVKPINPHQIVPAVKAALARGAELYDLQNSKINMTLALESAHNSSIGVGILMNKFHIPKDVAFNTLRKYARDHQCSIHAASTALQANHDLIAAPMMAFRKGGKAT